MRNGQGCSSLHVDDQHVAVKLGRSQRKWEKQKMEIRRETDKEKMGKGGKKRKLGGKRKKEVSIRCVCECVCV